MLVVADNKGVFDESYSAHWVIKVELTEQRY